jgi:hypothetical protein
MEMDIIIASVMIVLFLLAMAVVNYLGLYYISKKTESKPSD